MEIVEGYDHQPGVHCGAGALRDVARYYGWTYSEAACFGIGGGAAFVLYEHPEEPWVTFRASPTWLERAFFERLEVRHATGRGEDFESAWANVAGRIDDDDPAILFLDPTDLPYLPEDDDHVPPHTAVAVGYDDEEVVLADAAAEERQTVSRSDLRAAWTTDRFLTLENEYVVVTNARVRADGNDAAAAGLRHAATYALAPLQIQRDARGPGEEGLPALRSFADYVGTWPDLPEPARPVEAALRAIDEHGDGSAYRELHADALEELGQRTGIPPEVGGRLADVGREWRSVASVLEDVVEAEEPRAARFEEAASLLGDVADREEDVFGTIAEELGRVDERE